MSLNLPILARRYALHEIIGSGAYGVVATARDTLNNNEKVAVKCIRRVLETYPMATRILRELKFLRLLRGHENIMELKTVLLPVNRERLNNTYLVCELLPLDLRKVIHLRVPLEATHVCYLMFQLLRGIRYMHNSGVLHRDLKPDNILLDGDCRLKICDFGLARAAFRAENDSDLVLWTNYVATRWYRAPELIMPRATNYGKPIDVWSAGCIFAEIILRKPLFPGEDTRDQLRRIIEFTGKPHISMMRNLRSAQAQELIANMPSCGPADLKAIFPPGTDEAPLRLISKMLQFDPDKRITAHDALMDDYFKQWREPLGFGTPSRAITEREFEFEKRLATNDEDSLLNIRRAFLEELAIHHPEKRAQLLGGGGTYEAYNAVPHAGTLPRERMNEDVMSTQENGHVRRMQLSTFSGQTNQGR